MDDWEDEPVQDVFKKGQVLSNWDDEDVEDDGVKDSWEDDEEPAPAPKVEAPPPEKAPKKVAAKPSEKKGKAVETAKEAPLDPLEEKLRQQRLVEEADFKATAELFAKTGDEKTLENFIPKSESDFDEYALLIAHKLRLYEKSFHYIGLLKAVMRHSLTSLKGADAKEVASSVTAIANEKIKAEKEANAGKKKTGTTMIKTRPSYALSISQHIFSPSPVERRSSCMLASRTTMCWTTLTMMVTTIMISCEPSSGGVEKALFLRVTDSKMN